MSRGTFIPNEIIRFELIGPPDLELIHDMLLTDIIQKNVLAVFKIKNLDNYRKYDSKFHLQSTINGTI